MSALSKNRNSVLFINPYYGKWPVWFPAFLHSCRLNPKFNWLIPTDCGIPPEHPENVTFVESTIAELSNLATKKLGFDVALTRPYKVNDIRPAFGLIFNEQLGDYDFWGHCDIDLIWGDLSKFITDDILDTNDIIATRAGKISGHCTIYKNNSYINNLFRGHELHKKAFTSDESFYFDEVGMTGTLQKLEDASGVKICWPGMPFNYADKKSLIKSKGPSYIPKYMNRWRWENGRLYEYAEKKEEVMYLHFMTWKKTLQYCSFDYNDRPESFYISYTHIGRKKAKFPSQIVGLRLHKWFPGHFS